MNNINEERVTNIQKLIELGESASNIPELENICENYELKEIASWGIEDVSFFRQPITDFKQIKKLMEKMPLDVIPMPRDKKLYAYNYGDEIKQHKFIEKYGIDNIILLNEETKGLFSHKYSDDEIYLLVLATGDEKILDEEINREFTYKEFKNRIYEILKKGKENGEIFSYFPSYSFIEGDFRKEYQDIFIDDYLDKEIQEKFYKGNLTAKDIRENKNLIEILKEKDVISAMGKDISKNTIEFIVSKYGKEKFLKLCETYGEYFSKISHEIYREVKDLENYQDVVDKIENKISEKILTRKIGYDENAPEFLKKNKPELFLESDAPDKLKEYFYTLEEYDSDELNFKILSENPEFITHIKGKLISRAMPAKYEKLFDEFNDSVLIKLGKSKPDVIDKMVKQNKEKTLGNWYKATGCKFIPNYIVMNEFPEKDIDKFLMNGKKWSKLMRYNKCKNDEEIKSLVKATYAMGVFHNDDRAFNKIKDLLECENSDKKIENFVKIFSNLNTDYNEKFAEFLHENFEKIINSNYYEEIEKIQKKFQEIVVEYSNQSNGITLERAVRFVDKNVYNNIDIGNEKMANAVKKQGYLQNNEEYRKTGNISQSDFCGFDELQELYNEGMKREFSSIPRVEGNSGKYTYEILRLDDPLSLVIGDISNCCQDINGIAKTSMQHSVKSKDGRIFVVRDREKNIVAQSWLWRNQDVICFDNIEIPKKAYERYLVNPQKEDEGLAKEIVKAYKEVAKQFREVENLKYEQLLKNCEISQEQYEGLLLGKVTIGLGFNMIKETLDNDKELKRDSEPVQVKTDESIGLDYIHSDAYKTNGQQVIFERSNRKKTNLNNIYVYEDTIKEYNTENIEEEILESIQRMLTTSGSDKSVTTKEEFIYEYSKNAKILSTPRMNFIYSKNEKGAIEIKDILTSPIKQDASDKQKNEAQQFLTRQVKKALKQIGIDKENVNILNLENQGLELYENAISEIEKEEEQR